ncbi:phosphate ABC transporter ATP-binding protein [Desertibacillus haloalkaliphilus]|nr:phosphate ABC transporter ATP-binding protein [Desertibacillus haloalkaliphilus]
MELSNVSTQQLSNITLTVEKGECLALIGPSGAGKSSLLKLLNRLEDPTKGWIRFKGKSLFDYPILELRQTVGMVFQSPALFDGTVEANLKYGPSLNGTWEPSQGKRLLEQVQLPQTFLTREVDELSGGEKQRVALARTLANQPDVLLLDEVTSALDLKNVESIERLLKSLLDQEKTIFIVTHNLNQAERLGDRTVYMEAGKIIEQGETTRLLNEPQTAELKQFLKES